MLELYASAKTSLLLRFRNERAGGHVTMCDGPLLAALARIGILAVWQMPSQKPSTFLLLCFGVDGAGGDI